MLVFHGTTENAAESIRSEGIRIDASVGGNFGRAFYVAERHRDTEALAQFGDEETGAFECLTLRLTTPDGMALLDVNDPADWDRWAIATNHGRLIGLSDFPTRMIRAGIAGIRDIGGCGGWAIYEPAALEILTGPDFCGFCGWRGTLKTDGIVYPREGWPRCPNCEAL